MLTQLPDGLAEQTAASPIRQLLRVATQDVHDRLHAHDGFSSIKTGTINKRSYVLLLRRLYGFYFPFEHHADLCNDRSSWLGSDLSALGVAAEHFGGIRNCSQIPQLNTPNRRLGALYVVAGSALGGRELSRGLDRILGVGITSGREFFLGYGDRTGEVWRQCLANLALGHLDFFGFQRHTAVRPVEVGKGTADWRAVTWFCVCRAALRAGSVPVRGLIGMSGRLSFMPGMG